MVDLVDRECDLRRVRLDAGLADIGDQCVDQTALLLDEHRTEPFQLRCALLVVPEHPGVKALVEDTDDVGNAIDGGHRPRLGVTPGV